MRFNGRLLKKQNTYEYVCAMVMIKDEEIMNFNKDVPVLFLIFNRPDTTKQVFEAIREAKPRRLYVMADGPRLSREGEEERCLQTRKIIDQVDWKCKVETQFFDKNLGCQKILSSSRDWFFEHEEMGVILEDDCLPAPSFFSFCSELLERYKNDTRIMMISGNNFQDGQVRGEASYYFSRLSNTWGSATWRRAWKLMDLEMSLVEDFRKPSIIDDIFLDENIALAWRLAFAYTRFKKVSSWAYPWFFSMLVQNGLSIVPNKNLVKNIGFGEGSTHTTNLDSKFANLPLEQLEHDLIHPKAVFPNQKADRYEHFCLNCFPLLEKMSLKYRWKRMRRARRFRMKINELYS